MATTPIFNVKINKSAKSPSMKVSTIKSKIIVADMTDIATEPWSVQLTPNDIIMPRGYIQLCYFFKNNTKKSGFMAWRKLKRSLSYALRYFPILAGRLRNLKDGGMIVKVNNKGIQLIKASADFSMTDIETKGGVDMNLVSTGITPAFVDIPYLLRVQITYLKDNSVILCALVNHSVCDGPGAFTFLRAWAEIASARDNALADLAVDHERKPLYPDFKPARYPHEELRVYRPEEWDQSEEPTPPACAQCTFQLSSDKLTQIRKRIEETDCAVTNQNIICALFWRFVTRARGLAEGSQTAVGVACNGRSRIDPPLPKGYFGNAVFYGSARLDTEQVMAMPVAELSVYVHEAEDNINDDYIRSVINWIESQQDKSLIGPGFNCCYGNDLAISSWSQLPVFDMDFGDGRPISFKVPFLPVDGVMMILPLREDGDVEVTLGLQKDHLEKLLEDEEVKSLLLS